MGTRYVDSPILINNMGNTELVRLVKKGHKACFKIGKRLFWVTDKEVIEGAHYVTIPYKQVKTKKGRNIVILGISGQAS